MTAERDYPTKYRCRQQGKGLESFWYRVRNGYVCGVFGFATTLLFLNPILEIFSGGDSGFSQLIRQIFVLEMLSNIFLSVHAAMMALFYAFGYTRLSFVLNFSRLFVFRLPVLLFFLYCTDLAGGTAMGW